MASIIIVFFEGVVCYYIIWTVMGLMHTTINTWCFRLLWWVWKVDHTSNELFFYVDKLKLVNPEK